MKRCICALAFPVSPVDLQYKVKRRPRCRSFDRDGWSHCGCNKIKLLHVDIFLLMQKSHQARSKKYTLRRRPGSWRIRVVTWQPAAGSWWWDLLVVKPAACYICAKQASGISFNQLPATWLEQKKNVFYQIMKLCPVKYFCVCSALMFYVALKLPPLQKGSERMRAQYIYIQYIILVTVKVSSSTHSGGGLRNGQEL